MAEVIPLRHLSAALPTGTVTFLLTDVEGSVKGWEADQAAMARAVALHHRILDATVVAHQGARPKDQGEGDSIVAAFERASDAVACALEIQLSMIKQDWGTSPISVRIAIHTGEAHLRDESNYYGQAINRCARLRAIANGGQTILSQSTHDLVMDHLPEGASLKDMGAHRLRDLARPEHVYQLCHPALPVSFPPLRSLDAFPNNLPVQLKTFVPREAEIKEVESRLDSYRLVTLTGAGGAGKTRLAMQIAADLLEDFADGTWLVDLAAVTDPGLLVRSVTSALGLQEGGSALEGVLQEVEQARSPVERLLDYLKAKQLLLIFDNCEHLISACAGLVQTILTSCPKITILVTSREPLGVEGEATWRVPSLSLPDEGGESVAETYQAVRLFVERAALSKADFRLTPENARAIGEICRRLDGMPLSIELAAARVKVLSPQQIASMLDDQFRLLTGGSRTALERQQTLRASVDWGYNLLTEPEKMLLRRFSVFGGGATLEAVEAICSGDGVSRLEILDLLSLLVDKSMIEVAEDDGNIRYRTLETIRQYSRERLLESGEGPRLRNNHRDFFLDLAQRAAPNLEWGDEMPWLDLLDREQANFGIALAWTIDSEEASTAARLVHALRKFFVLRGNLTEGRQWCRRALALDLTGDLRIVTLADSAWFALADWDVPVFKSLIQEILDATSSSAPRELAVFRADALIWNSYLHLWEARYDEAISTAEEGLQISREIGHHRGIWAGTMILALMVGGTELGELSARRDRDSSTARALAEEALIMARTSKSTAALAETLGWSSRIAMGEMDFASARDYVQGAIEASQLLKNLRGTAFWLNQLAYIAMQQEDYTLARTSLEEAIALSQHVGDAVGAANYQHSLGELAEAEGDYDLANTLFVESLALGRDIPMPFLVSECEWGLARLATHRGDHRESLARVRAALIAMENEGNPTPLVRRLAQGLVRAGYLAEAAQLLGVWEAMAESRLGHSGHKVESPLESVPEQERVGLEADLAALREGLGEERMKELWDEGQQVAPQDAVGYALRISEVR